MYESLTEAFLAFLRDNGVAFAGLAGAFGLTTLAAVDRWLHTRRELKAVKLALQSRSREENAEVRERLHSLEGAVDTLSLGVERLNETELFAARLFAEKRIVSRSERITPDPARASTPH